MPEGHDTVGRIQQYSTLVSRTPSSIDDSRGRQATGSNAIHAMVGYRGSASTFVRADHRHICHALVSELGNLLTALRGVEPNGGHCSWFGHSFYCGCCVDQQDQSHHDHSARWLDRHQKMSSSCTSTIKARGHAICTTNFPTLKNSKHCKRLSSFRFPLWRTDCRSRRSVIPTTMSGNWKRPP